MTLNIIKRNKYANYKMKIMRMTAIPKTSYTMSIFDLTIHPFFSTNQTDLRT